MVRRGDCSQNCCMTKLDALLQPASTPSSTGGIVPDKAQQQLVVRMATIDDAEILNSMIADFAAFERLPNHSTIETVRKELSSSDRVIETALAFIDGEAVGMAVFFQTYSTFAARRGLYLEDIYVKEDYRNRGIATALLRFIAKWAVERHYARVEFTVLLWNTVAIEFFETMGATPTNAWTTYRLSGEWLEKLATMVEK
jgi:GNAT superfamily N-acetyltransferase